MAIKADKGRDLIYIEEPREPFFTASYFFEGGQECGVPATISHGPSDGKSYCRFRSLLAGSCWGPRARKLVNNSFTDRVVDSPRRAEKKKVRRDGGVGERAKWSTKTWTTSARDMACDSRGASSGPTREDISGESEAKVKGLRSVANTQTKQNARQRGDKLHAGRRMTCGPRDSGSKHHRRESFRERFAEHDRLLLIIARAVAF